MPDIREEFEARYPLPEGMYRTDTGYAGHSNYWLYTELWVAWQASRAALKVELPRPYGQSLLDIDPDFEQYNRGIRDCKEALQKAGIEVM